MSDRRPSNLHVHEIEGGFILHADHDLGEGAEALDPIPHEGHQHLMALIARNYVNEISGPAESVRRGVESGTIKGEEVMWCVTHGVSTATNPCWVVVFDEDRPAELRGAECSVVSKLVIDPVDVGEDR